MRWSFFLRIVAIEALLFGASSVHAGDAKCPVTELQRGWIGNDELRVGIPDAGRIVFRPEGPGFVDEDGALGWKFLWKRLVHGQLQIEGNRIDGEAPPLRVQLAATPEEIGFQPSYLIFPQPGCWRILARVHGDPLSFVIQVEKIGDGPAWRRKKAAE